MPYFRLFLVGVDGHIVSLAAAGEYPSDGVAAARAAEISAQYSQMIEIWDRDRMVGCVPTPPEALTETSGVLRVR